MKISTLIEDGSEAGSEAGSAVRGEHGLSLHIETAGQRILFDVGASSLFIDNAAKLGVDIAAAADTLERQLVASGIAPPA